MTIQGIVAGVINERELSINIGKKKGVKKGMMFKVLASEPLEIRDPETDEVLGTLDREKVRVKVAEVHERFSLCRTFRTKMVGGFGMYGLDLGSSPREVTETLKADGAEYPPPLSEEDSYVKSGDRVVKVSDDE